MKTSLRTLLFLLALSPALALAAKNPLNTIEAEGFDDKSGNLTVEACSEGGQDVAGMKDGDYLVFKGYDFDSGVAGFKARVSSVSGGKFEIRLDGPLGVLMGYVTFDGTGGAWKDIVTQVDNSQAGVRDVYVVFRGGEGASTNLNWITFLKSIVAPGNKAPTDLATRIDAKDDEPQGTKAWGMPEAGFSDGFEQGLAQWKTAGIAAAPGQALDGSQSAVFDGKAKLGFAYTPDVYIDKTDTGGEWRTLAEASLSADIEGDEKTSRPGLGFSSKDGKQWVYVVLNFADNTLEAYRRQPDGKDLQIRVHPKNAADPTPKFTLETGKKYRMELDWSPYSNALMVFLRDEAGAKVTDFRTAIDLPAARRPLIVATGGPARFDDVKFDPTLDAFNYQWEWKKEPVLTPDMCNPTVWKGKDGKFYMMWRRFGKDTFHGIASSPDAVHWKVLASEILKCTGDMNVVVDPFGDGLVWVTPGNDNTPWSTSDGSDNYTTWKDSGKKLGGIFGNNRIQEIIDTKRYPQMKPVNCKGTDYRFIAFCENWTNDPKPHTVVLLSNTLTEWVLADPNPVLPPRNDFWGEKGSAIGSAFPLPDGNIMLASCSCTFAGYTGAPEPSNVTVIVDGSQPWKILNLAKLPDAPMTREHTWYEGPNFGTAYFYDEPNDTLYYYGGFHDYNIGVMRIRNFSKGPGPHAAER